MKPVQVQDFLPFLPPVQVVGMRMAAGWWKSGGCDDWWQGRGCGLRGTVREEKQESRQRKGELLRWAVKQG